MPKTGQPIRIVADGSGAYGALAVDDQVLLAFAQNQSRAQVALYNLGPDTVYMGYDDDVTAANGWPIPMGAAIAEDQVESTIYLVCDTGETADVRWVASDDVAVPAP